jgi:hypothetical protein
VTQRLGIKKDVLLSFATGMILCVVCKGPCLTPRGWDQRS